MTDNGIPDNLSSGDLETLRSLYESQRVHKMTIGDILIILDQTILPYRQTQTLASLSWSVRRIVDGLMSPETIGSYDNETEYIRVFLVSETDPLKRYAPETLSRVREILSRLTRLSLTVSLGYGLYFSRCMTRIYPAGSLESVSFWGYLRQLAILQTLTMSLYHLETLKIPETLAEYDRRTRTQTLSDDLETVSDPEDPETDPSSVWSPFELAIETIRESIRDPLSDYDSDPDPDPMVIGFCGVVETDGPVTVSARVIRQTGQTDSDLETSRLIESVCQSLSDTYNPYSDRYLYSDPEESDPEDLERLSRIVSGLMEIQSDFIRETQTIGDRLISIGQTLKTDRDYGQTLTDLETIVINMRRSLIRPSDPEDPETVS